MAKNEVIEILINFISLLREEGIAVKKAFLYGSYSTNTAKKDSDIDVMIVTDTEDDYLIGNIWKLTKRINSKIEPYIVSNNRFNQSNNSPLIEFVKEYGIEIA